MDNSGHLFYARKFEGTWAIEWVETPDSVDHDTSLALDSGDNPHISFLDYTGTTLLYARKSGSTWTIDWVAYNGEGIIDTSLALDSGDNPHISFSRAMIGLFYASNVGGGWTGEEVDLSTEPWDISLALDSGGNPHISYVSTNGVLKYASKNAGTWTVETVDSGVRAASTSLLITPGTAATAWISYYDTTNGDLKVAEKDYGAEWIFWRIDHVGDVRSVGGYARTCAALRGWSWDISYYDATHGDLKYARWGARETWCTDIVDSTGDVGWFTSVAVDMSGNQHISYYDATNSALKYAYGFRMWPSDSSGALFKFFFVPSETVYVTVPAMAKTVTLYVVVNKPAWSDGDALADVSGGAERLTLNPGPGTQTIQIWAPPLRQGRYDIVMDIDNDGVYHRGTDPLCFLDIFGPGSFFVMPEVPFGTALLILSWFIVLLGFWGFKHLRLKCNL